MPDSKSKRGKPDRIRVAKGQPYEVGYFARKHGIPRDKARQIIERNPMRAKADAAAEKIKP